MEREVIMKKSFKNIDIANKKPVFLDAIIDVDGNFIFLMVIPKKATLKRNERIALEDLVDNTEQSESGAIAVVSEYEKGVSDTVKVSKCNVKEIYLSLEKTWRKTKSPKTVSQIISWAIQNYLEESE